MDVFTELLPASLLVKPEQTAGDRKQKSKGRYKNLSKAYAQNANEQQTLPVGVTTLNWDNVERRSGADRREHDKCRGRWLESRAEKDRRQLSKAIFVKI